MLYQVLFSGRLKNEHSAPIAPKQISRVFELVDRLNYTGISIFIDGSFMTLYEGDVKMIEATFDFYASLPRYNHVLTLIKRPIAKRDFKDFKLGLRKIDYNGVIGEVPNCFSLSPEELEAAIPAHFPMEYKVLLRTFTRVNNTCALEAI